MRMALIVMNDFLLLILKSPLLDKSLKMHSFKVYNLPVLSSCGKNTNKMSHQYTCNPNNTTHKRFLALKIVVKVTVLVCTSLLGQC